MRRGGEKNGDNRRAVSAGGGGLRGLHDGISIHAPHTGSDYGYTTLATVCDIFQSTPPRGERPALTRFLP